MANNRYEYYLLDVDDFNSVDKVEDMLNKLGKEGWHIVSQVPICNSIVLERVSE